LQAKRAPLLKMRANTCWRVGQFRGTGVIFLGQLELTAPWPRFIHEHQRALTKG
jgi:hypothetical protein